MPKFMVKNGFNRVTTYRMKFVLHIILQLLLDLSPSPSGIKSQTIQCVFSKIP